MHQPTEKDASIFLIEQEMGCPDLSSNLPQIANPKDAGTKFYIINDQLCQNVSLSSHPYPRSRDGPKYLLSKVDYQT